MATPVDNSLDVSLFRKRSKEPGAFCPVCGQLELVVGGRGLHWKCRECGTRIPDRSYVAFMARALDPGGRARAPVPGAAPVRRPVPTR